MKGVRSLSFDVYNGVTPISIRSCRFIVYAHQIGQAMYIGYSFDPVQRWNQHVSDAYDSYSPNHGSIFKAAIRSHGTKSFRHLILEVARSEEMARRKEAEAVRFYRPSLNEGATIGVGIKKRRLRTLYEQEAYSFRLEKTKIIGSWKARSDADRSIAIAEVRIERRRKRLVSLRNQNFEAGLRIECSRAEREAFNEGDVVCLLVAESTRHERRYLVARKSSGIMRYEPTRL